MFNTNLIFSCFATQTEDCNVGKMANCLIFLLFLVACQMSVIKEGRIST